MVYVCCSLYDDMDDDGYGVNLINKCIYCGIPRDELYMGGGLYVYRCPKCGSSIEGMKQ